MRERRCSGTFLDIPAGQSLAGNHAVFGTRVDPGASLTSVGMPTRLREADGTFELNPHAPGDELSIDVAQSTQLLQRVPLRSLSERIWYGKACRLPLLGRSRDASIQVK